MGTAWGKRCTTGPATTSRGEPPLRRSEALLEALRMVAPGTALRDGIDRILQANKGALIVVGDGPEVLSVCSGGFLLDAEFTPQRLSELAKMDGAIALNGTATKIAWCNVQLMQDLVTTHGCPVAVYHDRHSIFRVVTGKEPSIGIEARLGAMGDSGVMAAAGIETCVFGPGIMHDAAQLRGEVAPDESISIQELEHAAHIMTLAAVAVGTV